MQQSSAANTQDSRVHARSNVFLSASLAVGDASAPVRIRNISAIGAKLDGESLPAEGAVVRLRRGALTAGAQVAWKNQNYCGIRFEHPIDIAPWVRRVEHLGQHRVDLMVAALKAGEDAVVGQSPTGSIGEISLELCRTTEELVDLPGLTIDLAEKLLRLDAAVQRLREWVQRAS